jgi:LmbE family N-acetylglucosaminyl deacetylase
VRYLILSPHLDDAALSCGGLLAQRAIAGDEVAVATVFTGDAPVNWRESPAAHHVHAEWKLGNQPYPLRRREDEESCAVLGARPYHLGLHDAVYRFDAQGRPYYTDNFMGGKPVPEDARAQGVALQHALDAWLHRNGLRQLRVVAPLGLGGHVDHMIVRAAAEKACTAHRLKLSYFEDYPYGEREDVAASLAVRDLTPHVLPLTAGALETRIRAVLCYPSQLQSVFRLPSGEDLERVVRARITAYATAVGGNTPGERYWQA